MGTSYMDNYSRAPQVYVEFHKKSITEAVHVTTHQALDAKYIVSTFNLQFTGSSNKFYALICYQSGLEGTQTIIPFEDVPMGVNTYN